MFLFNIGFNIYFLEISTGLLIKLDKNARIVTMRYNIKT